MLAEMNSRIWVQKGDSTPAPVNSSNPPGSAPSQETKGPNTISRMTVEVNSEKEMAPVGVP